MVYEEWNATDKKKSIEEIQKELNEIDYSKLSLGEVLNILGFDIPSWDERMNIYPWKNCEHKMRIEDYSINTLKDIEKVLRAYHPSQLSLGDIFSFLGVEIYPPNALFDVYPWKEKDKKEEPIDRKYILDKALSVITGERQDAYGNAEDSFKRIAMLWSAYTGTYISEEDVANMMVLLKVARCKGQKFKADNYIDMAGYAALGAELGQQRTPSMPGVIDE